MQSSKTRRIGQAFLGEGRDSIRIPLPSIQDYFDYFGSELYLLSVKLSVSSLALEDNAAASSRILPRSISKFKFVLLP